MSGSRGTPGAAPLQPKPPELFQHIAWVLSHWREYKRVVFVGLFIVVGSAMLGILKVTGYGLVDLRPKNQSDGMRLPNADNQTTPKTSEEGHSTPALRVRFRDGTEGHVEFSVSAALDPARLLEVHQRYGDAERAAADLKHAVESAVYKSMETLTIVEARQSRSRIEASVIDLTKEAQRRTGYTIYQVSLKQIEEAP